MAQPGLRRDRGIAEGPGRLRAIQDAQDPQLRGVCQPSGILRRDRRGLPLGLRHVSRVFQRPVAVDAGADVIAAGDSPARSGLFGTLHRAAVRPRPEIRRLHHRRQPPD